MSNIHNENLKENKMHDIIEELEKKFTIKDLHTILNHITFWLYKNINDKYTDEFVQVDNLALLRSIKELKDDIVNKKFDRYIRKDLGELTVPLDETVYFDEYQKILDSKAKTEEEYLHNKENKIDI